MEGPELISEALGRVNAILRRSLDGAPADMLCRMPAPHANSMGWIAWHLTRRFAAQRGACAQRRQQVASDALPANPGCAANHGGTWCKSLSSIGIPE